MAERAHRYPARRGDTLADLAREFRVPLPLVESLNPDLEGTTPLEAGREVLLPLPEGSCRVRLDAGGPLVVHARSHLRTLLHETALEGALLPVYCAGDSPDFRLRVRIDRHLPAGEGTIRGVAFLTDDRDDPFRSLPVRSYAVRIGRGTPSPGAVPALDAVLRDLEGRGLGILRIFEEARPGEVVLPFALSDLRDALRDCRRPRIRVFCTDGIACDTDRTSRLALLRLLVEWKGRAPARGRALLSVNPATEGEERISQVEGEEWTEVLPCPLAGEIRVCIRRTGGVRRCVADGDLTLEFLSDLGPAEDHSLTLIVYVREGGREGPLYQVCPERRTVPPGTWERESRRIDVEECRVLLLFDRDGSGLRLEEAWIDGVRRK
jgi:hypothetical protein